MRKRRSNQRNRPEGAAAKVAETAPSFFFRGLRFADGLLTVVLGDAKADHTEITFEYVRTFAFLKESDFHKEFGRYGHVRLIPAHERTLGVFRLTRGAILEQVLKHRLDAENPQYFWVSTPDECLEVVGFSQPQVKRLSGQSQA